MYNTLIVTVLIMIFTISNLNAVECEQKSYLPTLKNIPKTLDYLSNSSVTPQTLESLKRVGVSKKNYLKDMERLKEKLSLLQKKKEWAVKAKKLNSNNIQFWTSLEKNCRGDNLVAVKKINNDVRNIDKIIDQRLATIEHYINITKIGIEIGQKKYSSNEKQ